MASGPQSRELTLVLDSLQSGQQVRPSQLTAFSDLGRDDAKVVRERWASIPLPARLSAVTRAAELAEDNVDLDFTQLSRVGLGDTDAEVRRTSAEALWESTDRQVAEELTALLGDPDSGVRAAAAGSLHNVVLQREFDAIDPEAGDAAVARLRVVAEDPGQPVDVRARALESLGPRSLPWVATLINDAYYQEDDVLRLAAIHAMGESSDDRWLEFLEEQLQSDNPAFRLEAAYAFGSLGMEDGIGPLASVLESEEDVEVLFAVVNALGDIGGRAAVDHLELFARQAGPEFDEVLEAAIASAKFILDEVGEL